MLQRKKNMQGHWAIHGNESMLELPPLRLENPVAHILITFPNIQNYVLKRKELFREVEYILCVNTYIFERDGETGCLYGSKDCSGLR